MTVLISILPTLEYRNRYRIYLPRFPYSLTIREQWNRIIQASVRSWEEIGTVPIDSTFTYFTLGEKTRTKTNKKGTNKKDGIIQLMQFSTKLTLHRRILSRQFHIYCTVLNPCTDKFRARRSIARPLQVRSHTKQKHVPSIQTINSSSKESFPPQFQIKDNPPNATRWCSVGFGPSFDDGSTSKDQRSCLSQKPPEYCCLLAPSIRATMPLMP